MVITVRAWNPETIEPHVFYETENYIAMEASHFQRRVNVSGSGFEILTPYGRTGSGIKVFPVTEDFLASREKPYVEYHFVAEQDGEYQIDFYMAATTPVVYESRQYIGYDINASSMQIVNTVENDEIPFFLSPQWRKEAFEQIKITSAVITCKKGKNTLRFYGVSPAVILERIVLHSTQRELPPSYLGPKESFFAE